jgi:hypothetical protein
MEIVVLVAANFGVYRFARGAGRRPLLWLLLLWGALLGSSLLAVALHDLLEPWIYDGEPAAIERLRNHQSWVRGALILSGLSILFLSSRPTQPAAATSGAQSVPD